MQKTFFIQSLGCPKNLVDSEVMLGLLEQAGYFHTANPEDADILLINTCGFIQEAVEEAIDAILILTQYKASNPEKLLVVTGCVVQRYRDKLKSEFPEVDLFIGTDGFQNIVALLESQPTGQLNINPAPHFVMDNSYPRRVSTPPHRAYLKITEGCSNRCYYCLIPSIRGPLRSRSVADLVNEVHALEKAGTKEITLVGQDLTAYGIDMKEDKTDLADLLKALVDSSSIPWIRLLYLYPVRVQEKLLELMAKEPRILPYLDIPLQHVSDRVLKAMNRPFGRKHVEEVIQRIKSYLPEAAIRTTFMVGYPGEREDDFDQLAEFLTQNKLYNVGIFEYSNEEGSVSADLPEQIAGEIKERKNRLLELQSKISLEINTSFIGKKLPVFIEGLSQESELLLEGRTKFQAAEIDGCVYINSGHCNAGDIVEVKITEAHPYDLVGEICK